jgi:apolipoprotein N-acyltransferase
VTQPGRKSAVIAFSTRPCSESMLTAWAQSFLFAGSSALLLSVANRFPNYWYFSFFALTPFLYRTIKATPVESLRLGFIFGLSFFGASATGSAGISPFITILRLLAGTALFAFFGWTVGWARQRWGFNPSLVAVLWVGLEMGLANLGLGVGLFGETAFSQPFLHGLVGLLGLLAASAIIVLLNSLLALAITKAVKAARIRVRTANQSVRTWDLLFAFNFSTQKAYLVPEGRAPPSKPEIV